MAKAYQAAKECRYVTSSILQFWMWGNTSLQLYYGTSWQKKEQVMCCYGQIIPHFLLGNPT